MGFFLTGALVLWLVCLKGYAKRIAQVNGPALIELVRRQQLRRLVRVKTAWKHNCRQCAKMGGYPALRRFRWLEVIVCSRCAIAQERNRNEHDSCKTD
jgi:hypothetical protein